MDNTVEISQLPEATEISDDSVIPAVVDGVTSGVKAGLLKGQQGEKGETGDTGPEGPPGPQGAPGKDGTDAAVQIEQSTGDSEEAVMSQNAVTVALDELDASLKEQITSDLEDYYTKAETNDLVSKIPKFAITVVDALPTEEISETTVYLVKTSDESQNLYSEYIYVDEKWELLGQANIDLTNYYTKSETDATIAAQVNSAKSELQTQIDELEARPVPAFSPYFASKYIPSLYNDDQTIYIESVVFSDLDRTGKYLVIVNSFDYLLRNETNTEDVQIANLQISTSGLDVEVGTGQIQLGTTGGVYKNMGAQFLFVDGVTNGIGTNNSLQIDFRVSGAFAGPGKLKQFELYANQVYIYLLRVG